MITGLASPRFGGKQFRRQREDGGFSLASLLRRPRLEIALLTVALVLMLVAFREHFSLPSNALVHGSRSSLFAPREEFDMDMITERDLPEALSVRGKRINTLPFLNTNLIPRVSEGGIGGVLGSEFSDASSPLTSGNLLFLVANPALILWPVLMDSPESSIRSREGQIIWRSDKVFEPRKVSYDHERHALEIAIGTPGDLQEPVPFTVTGLNGSLLGLDNVKVTSMKNVALTETGRLQSILTYRARIGVTPCAPLSESCLGIVEDSPPPLEFSLTGVPASVSFNFDSFEKLLSNEALHVTLSFSSE